MHRDLKPANVKLTPDGKVKVLDFGLAKAWEGPGAASSDLSQSPTLAHTGTAAGLILGTAAYVSPEQARGKLVDKRADIWAFGVVLWEMLTGQKLFVGETVSDVLAAVLTRDPALAALPAGTPGAVRRLLRRYLERDPRQRLRDIGDARLALADEYGRAFAVSPDGSKLVYAVEAGPTSALRIRSLDSPCRRRSQARTGVWMTAFIADAVRESLARRRTGPNQPPVRLTTFRGSGLQPGVDLDDIAALQDLMNETDAATGR